jgi:hypothetical protein
MLLAKPRAVFVPSADLKRRLSSATDQPFGGNAAVRSLKKNVREVRAYWRVYRELAREAVQ